MSFQFGKTSRGNLEGVHPDLVRVAELALKYSPHDFGITEGVRTKEKQRQNIINGVSGSEDSRHFIQDDGHAHAIDIAVYVNGKVTWEHGYYRRVIQAFVTAAIELGVQMRFGGLWKDISPKIKGPDCPHIELDKKYY